MVFAQHRTGDKFCACDNGLCQSMVGGPKLLLTQGFVPTFSPLSSSVLSSTESRIRFHRQSISVRKTFIAGVAAESACWSFESSYSI